MDNLLAPVSNEENINKSEIEFYSCSKCFSNIEILSIDDKEVKITFNCLNNEQNNNHKTQEMDINEYIQNLEKINYSECSICHKINNYIKNFPNFYYCTNCKIIFCNDCKNEHLKKNRMHILINNKEKRTKCINHQNNKFIVYCFDCNKHICNKCLKTKEHISHKKINISESLPFDEDKIILNEIINILKRNKKRLEDEAKFGDINIDEKILELNYRKGLESIDLQLKNDLYKIK